MRVFDTSAVLALIYKETGADIAQAKLPQSLISVVNVAEVIGVLMRRSGLSPSEAERTLKRIPLHWADPNGDQAVRAAELSAVKELALGDRFCIALAEGCGEPLVTADQQWATLNLSVPVELIR